MHPSVKSLAGIAALSAGVGAVLLATMHPAAACSCRRTTRAEVIASAHLVFEGRVLSIRRQGRRNHVRFRVLRRIKGKPSDIVTIGTARSSAACGVRFSVGQKAIVPAYRLHGRGGAPLYSVNSCSMFGMRDR